VQDEALALAEHVARLAQRDEQLAAPQLGVVAAERVDERQVVAVAAHPRLERGRPVRAPGQQRLDDRLELEPHGVGDLLRRR